MYIRKKITGLLNILNKIIIKHFFPTKKTKKLQIVTNKKDESQIFPL